MNDLRLDVSRSLREIGRMYANLADQALAAADDPDIPGGDAMVMLGPGADVEAFGYMQLSAIMGRIDMESVVLDDIEPPLSFLASWVDIIREERGQHPSNRRATIQGELAYLWGALDWMTSVDEDGEPWWLPADDFSTQLRKVRHALESVVHDGFRPVRGMPCLYCRSDLLRDFSPRDGFLDSYTCEGCGKPYEKANYEYVVGISYLQHSPTLTAAKIEERTQGAITAGKVRVWGCRYDGLKAGRNPDGLLTYNVDAVLAKQAELYGEAVPA